MLHDELDWERGRLCVRWRGTAHRIDAASIREVNLCTFADAVLHADEAFHVLRLRSEFWIVGPFVRGAPRALARLLGGHRAPACVPVTVLRVPWRMRDAGLFGLRLWPIAGLGRHPNAALRQLGMAPAKRFSFGALPSRSTQRSPPAGSH